MFLLFFDIGHEAGGSVKSPDRTHLSFGSTFKGMPIETSS
jgi:hypothetical protein